MSPALVLILAFFLYAIPYGTMALGAHQARQFIQQRLGTLVSPPESLHVAVEAIPPIRFAGGEVDRVAIEVASATIAGIFPVEQLVVEGTDLRFDAGAAAWQQTFSLRAPLAASLNFVVNEEGLSHFVRSGLVRERLRGLKPPRGVLGGNFGAGLLIDIILNGATLDEGSITLRGQVQLRDVGLVVPVTLSVRPILQDPTHVALADLKLVVMGRTLTGDQAWRRLRLPQIIDLDTVAAGDAVLRMKSLSVSNRRLGLAVEGTILHLPIFGIGERIRQSVGPVMDVPYKVERLRDQRLTDRLLQLGRRLAWMAIRESGIYSPEHSRDSRPGYASDSSKNPIADKPLARWGISKGCAFANSTMAW